MHPHDSNPIVRRCTAIYTRLLKIYPGRFRREYDTLMTQLFRDQCRQALLSGGKVGLTGFWCRITADLVWSSAREQLSALIERILMLNPAWRTLRTNPIIAFAAPFVTVFVGAIALTLGLVLTLPNEYASTARLLVLPSDTSGSAVIERYDPYTVQTQMEWVQSDAVLERVAARLQETSPAPNRPDHLTTAAELRKIVEVRNVRNTSLLEIRAKGPDPEATSRVANEVAQAARELSHSATTNGRLRSVHLVEIARPGSRPVSPNKPLALFTGLMGGLVLATAAGAAGALFAVFRRGPARAAAK